MASTNLTVGWTGILLGLLAGAAIGLFFHDDAWLGGYGSWRRRMLRLGHVALVGTGLLNLAFAASVHSLGLPATPTVPASLFVLGAALMPAICFLSAWRKGFRNLFFLPVLGLAGAVASFLLWWIVP